MAFLTRGVNRWQTPHVCIHTSVKRSPRQIYAVWHAYDDTTGRLLKQRRIAAPNGVGEILAFVSALEWARRHDIAPTVYVGATLYELLSGRGTVPYMAQFLYDWGQRLRVKTQCVVCQQESNEVQA